MNDFWSGFEKAAEEVHNHKSNTLHLFGGGKRMSQDEKLRLRMHDEIRRREVSDKTKLDSHPYARIMGGGLGAAMGLGAGYEATERLIHGTYDLPTTALKKTLGVTGLAAAGLGAAYLGQRAGNFMAKRHYDKNKAKAEGLREQLKDME